MSAKRARLLLGEMAEADRHRRDRRPQVGVGGDDIAKSIIVLYRGAVVEAGSIDMVIREPRHPSTALLVESIPWPNLDRRRRPQPIKAQEAGGSQSGCQLRTRYPMTMEICAAEPPLSRLDAHHTAACLLHDAQPPIALERLSELLPA